MDETAPDMHDEETQRPQNDQDDRDGEKHESGPRLKLMVRFSGACKATIVPDPAFYGRGARLTYSRAAPGISVSAVGPWRARVWRANMMRAARTSWPTSMSRIARSPTPQS